MWSKYNPYLPLATISNPYSDAGALLLASTLPGVNLLAVNINYPSSYSAFAVSAILSYYGHSHVPVGILRPINNDTFFDGYFYELGEFASKVAYHWSNKTLNWDSLDSYWDPVSLYRKVLAEQKDGSVTIASIGFFENVILPMYVCFNIILMSKSSQAF